MRKLLLLAVLGTLPLAGCKNESTPDPKVPTTGTPAAATTPATYEVACAKCIYKIPAATGCVAGVKVDGKTMLLTGTPVDIHAAGGCEAPKQATIGGKVEGDKFVATKVEIKK